MLHLRQLSEPRSFDPDADPLVKPRSDDDAKRITNEHPDHAQWHYDRSEGCDLGIAEDQREDQRGHPATMKNDSVAPTTMRNYAPGRLEWSCFCSASEWGISLDRCLRPQTASGQLEVLAGAARPTAGTRGPLWAWAAREAREDRVAQGVAKSVGGLFRCCSIGSTRRLIRGA